MSPTNFSSLSINTSEPRSGIVDTVLPHSGGALAAVGGNTFRYRFHHLPTAHSFRFCSKYTPKQTILSLCQEKEDMSHRGKRYTQESAGSGSFSSSGDRICFYKRGLGSLRMSM
ncbi:hypothetical protein PIB30_061763 [Stylosanthes scabra]|uniref:Uncharacterized protein n=1 Tax=Stylosanthes scabra TaxID=79078 RepID=A0ABU6XLP1_9FABA|nr:hypothetical protein [Stylosanthes scabra]